MTKGNSVRATNQNKINFLSYALNMFVYVYICMYSRIYVGDISCHYKDITKQMNKRLNRYEILYDLESWL